MNTDLRAIAEQFRIDGDVRTVRPLGEGFINDTFLIETEADNTPNYILQRKNRHIFTDIPAMMENIRRVTDHLKTKIKARGGDSRREALTVTPTKAGELYFLDAEGEYWAACEFIADTAAYQQADTPELAFQGGKGIGLFQAMLADFREPLTDILPGFHNIRYRFRQWDETLAEDRVGRVKEVAREIGWIEERREEMLRFWSLVETGVIPTRVTHNDTKINNILFDGKTGEVLCVIDLDTVLSATCLNDYGDAMRSYTNTGAEDEKDLSKVSCDLELFALYTKGFIEGCGGSLTGKEIQMLPVGAKLMTLECGIRFLTDYLEGDVYFHTEREKQNLDRCRTQCKLVQDMEARWDELAAIAAKYR